MSLKDKKKAHASGCSKEDPDDTSSKLSQSRRHFKEYLYDEENHPTIATPRSEATSTSTAQYDNVYYSETKSPVNYYGYSGYQQPYDGTDAINNDLSGLRMNTTSASLYAQNSTINYASSPNNCTAAQPILIAYNPRSFAEHTFTKLGPQQESEYQHNPYDYSQRAAGSAYSNCTIPTTYYSNTQYAQYPAFDNSHVESANNSYASSTTIVPYKTEDNRPSTKTAPQSKKLVHKNIKGTKGKTEKLDPSYKVHNSKYFKPGQVFKILWAEPKGETASSGATDVTKYTVIGEGKYGESSYQTIRRFVIVAADHGHCQCLPVLTYQRRGTTKGGAKSDEHTIIYSGEDANTTPPAAEPGESLVKQPVRMIPKTPRDKLDPLSRLNYAKIYTVEHNVKVYFIGEIAPECRERFTMDFDTTWLQKRQM